MTVYILEPDDHVFSLNRLTARIGFLTLGEEVVMYDEASFEALSFQLDDIVVGGIGFAQRAMVQLGLSVPALDPIPKQLEAFAGREVWQSSMKELRAKVNAGEVIFAKPRPNRPKAFVGRLYSEFRDLIATAHISDDEPIDCSEPVEFLAEFRCFVLRGDPIGLRHYNGDPLILPDPAIVKDAVKAYADGPMGYALDFGVTSEGKTIIVEVNDGYAIGAYGLPPVSYANLIQARWDEIRAC